MGSPPRPARREAVWQWLSPLAACALTMLVAVHSVSHGTASAQRGANGALFALALDATSVSNFATYAASPGGENLEWNVWNHLTHRVAVLPRSDPLPRREAWTPGPTNS
jgi:hypothetical protein